MTKRVAFLALLVLGATSSRLFATASASAIPKALLARSIPVPRKDRAEGSWPGRHHPTDGPLWVAYSHDSGHTWQNAAVPVGVGWSRDAGVAFPRDTLVPYIVWQEGDSVLFTYDQSFPRMLFTPVLIDTGVGTPSLATTSTGDTVLISAGDVNRPGATHDVYLYRSLDHGVTWQSRLLLIDTQGNPDYGLVDCPRIQLGEGGYVFALFNWAAQGSDRFCPFYTESEDCGLTWSQPQMVWPTWPPYPDATCCWYGYDVILDPDDNHRPHCVIRLAEQDYDYGDIWEAHPTGGGPGNWTNWVAQVLIGDGMGGCYARHPSIGQDFWGSLYVTYSVWFIHSPADTFPDIGYCRSHDGGAHWSSPEPVTYDSIYETAIELADNVPGWSGMSCMHLLYVKEADNPTSVWHVAYDWWPGWPALQSIGPTQSYCLLGTAGKNICVEPRGETMAAVYMQPGVAVEERVISDQLTDPSGQLLLNHPNPFTYSTTIRYSLPPRPGDAETGRRGDAFQLTNVSVYDLAGRLVRTLVDEEQPPGFYEVVWDGEDSQGRRAVSGAYLYRLSSRHVSDTKKMILLR